MAKTNLHQVLADNVRRYHARIGISQDNFAIECGVHRAFVGSQPADDSESGSVLPIQVIFKK